MGEKKSVSNQRLSHMTVAIWLLPSLLQVEREERERRARRKNNQVSKQFLELQIDQEQEKKAEENAMKYKERQELRRQEARRQHLLEKAKEKKLKALSDRGVSEYSQRLAHLK